jgi:hypothetical protein
MKSKLLSTLALSLSLVGFAQAQTIINITGATAFRQAASNSIDAAFTAGGGAGSFGKIFNNTDSAGGSVAFKDATYQGWRGTFPGISGTTIIRASWNGSVEGIRAVVVGGVDNPLFVPQADVPASGTTGVDWATITSTLVQEAAQMTFSDVAASSTPISGSSLSGGPVGVVVFTMIANKQWRDDIAGDTAGLTNISAQQFRQLAADGELPLSFFSGNPAHTNKVYLTGRNDGSGTRTTYLAETGFGISKPVRQYVVHDRSTADLEKILFVPKGGGFNFQNVAQSANASTVWGLDQDGNGGYASGGEVRSDLAKSSPAAAVWAFEDIDDSGTYEATEDAQTVAPAKLYLASWLSVGDAKKAAGDTATTKAYILGYNGTRLDTFAGDVTTLGSTGLAAADRAKVVNGSYTAWGYEQLLYTTGSATAATVFTDLKSRLNSASVIGAAGIPIGEMLVNRLSDGGTVVPGALP